MNSPEASTRNSDIVLGDVVYGSIKNVNACVQAGIVPGISHRTNLTAEGKEADDIWAISVRDQLGGSPDVIDLKQISREEKKENQAYWKARIGHDIRWVVEGVFSIFEWIFWRTCNGPQAEKHDTRDTIQVFLYNKWGDKLLAQG